jgi:hypothetical protein
MSISDFRGLFFMSNSCESLADPLLIIAKTVQ